MLAAVAALLPTEARADCNHPWVRHTDRYSSLNDLDLFDSSHQGPNPDSGVPEKSEHRSPCAGGACSRLPALPIRTADPIPGQLELWGELPPGSYPRVASSDGIGFFPDRPRPARTTIPIERPPRAMAPR